MSGSFRLGGRHGRAARSLRAVHDIPVLVVRSVHAAGLAGCVDAAPPSPASTPDSACTGSDHNRDFLAAAAEAVEWDVHCATLPDGWFVERLPVRWIAILRPQLSDGVSPAASSGAHTGAASSRG